MINLLPNAEKKALRNEYRLRVAATALTFALAAELIAAVMFLPSLYNLIVNTRALEHELAVKKGSLPSDINVIETQVKALKADIELLRGDHDVLPTRLIDAVAGARTDGVTVWSFTYEKLIAPNALQIRGYARTHEDLLAFRGKLREHPLIASAEVPASLLLKDSDIDFTIKIVLRS